LVSYDCGSSHVSQVLCIIPGHEAVDGNVLSRNRRDWLTAPADDRIAQVEGELINHMVSAKNQFKAMQQEIDSLKIQTYVLYSLVGLSLILIIITLIGLFIIYRQARAYIIMKIRDILASLGDRVDGMTRRLERSLP